MMGNNIKKKNTYRSWSDSVCNFFFMGNIGRDFRAVIDIVVLVVKDDWKSRWDCELKDRPRVSVLFTLFNKTFLVESKGLGSCRDANIFEQSVEAGRGGKKDEEEEEGK